MSSAFGARASGARLERMHASARFIRGAFRNAQRVSVGPMKGTALSTVGEYFFGGTRRTPPAPLPSVDPRERWARPVETGLRATWLGHSTVLVEIDGARVLTDPVWSERISPVSFAGPRRFSPVPVAIDALPPIDVVLVSHDHYDHLDVATVVALARRGVPFVTTLGVGAHLAAWGVPEERITELDWWERHAVAGTGVEITATPSQHFSGRAPGDRNATLWCSFVVRGPNRVFFFSGDTGLCPEHDEIGRRAGPFDLVMLEVGAFHPAWGDIHLGPDNALLALGRLGGGAFLPIHWGTFNLALHAWDDPAETLVRTAPARGAQLVMPRLGEPIEPSRVERVEPWWRAIGAHAPEPASVVQREAEPVATLLEEPID